MRSQLNRLRLRLRLLPHQPPLILLFPDGLLATPVGSAKTLSLAHDKLQRDRSTSHMPIRRMVDV